MSPTSIELRDIGPVEEFTYQMQRPGLHVLRGHQGAGKTTILRTVQLAADGRTDIRPSNRDDTRRGEANIAGKTLLITKRVREEGEISVDGLGDLDIANLHTPKFVDPATRDRHRIKTLVKLAGAPADASLFYDLLKNREAFDEIVPADATSTDDLVEMAAKVKRAIERAAQDQEKREETARANMRAQAALCEGVDISLPDDEEPLRVALHEALQSESRMKLQRENALEMRHMAAKARTDLENLQKPDVEDLCTQREAAAERLRAAEEHVNDLTEQMTLAKESLATAEADMHRVSERLTHANEIVKHRDSLVDTINSAEDLDCPSENEIVNASAIIEKAQAAITMADKIRTAKLAQAESERHSGEAKTHGQVARQLRDAAKDTMTVLTDAVREIPGCPLRVIETTTGDPRLVLETGRSGSELFDDLSDGERWPHIIRLAAAKNRLIVLHQAAFGELAPSTRQLLDNLAREHDCYILTAQVDDGPLRAEAWESEEKVT